jgi:hypothetical protein
LCDLFNNGIFCINEVVIFLHLKISLFSAKKTEVKISASGNISKNCSKTTSAHHISFIQSQTIAIFLPFNLVIKKNEEIHFFILTNKLYFTKNYLEAISIQSFGKTLSNQLNNSVYFNSLVPVIKNFFHSIVTPSFQKIIFNTLAQSVNSLILYFCHLYSNV